MKSSNIFAAAALSLGLVSVPVLTTAPAQAVGCLSGGAAGAVAGHYAGHHAMLGAVGGCIAGHHMHKVQMRNRAAAAQAPMASPSPMATPMATPSPSGT